jgi:ELWxxDGT repeat protein
LNRRYRRRCWWPRSFFGPYVYFIASADGAGERLWRTDGTAAGTAEVSAGGPEEHALSER